MAVSPERSEASVRNFGTFTDEYEALAEWLDECQVRIVAMESTGVDWIALYELLERRGFEEVHLVNPRATKQVSGRKAMCWTAVVMAIDELRPAQRGIQAAG